MIKSCSLNCRALLAAMLLACLVAPESSAGLLNGAGSALPGFTGSVAADGNTGGIFIIDSDIDYAVFAPGDFQSFLTANSIPFADPAPSEYIYAYQINVNTASSGVSDFTVGIDMDDPRGSVSPTAIPATGDRPPTFSADQPTQEKWSFDGTLLTGETSEILLFSNPFPPEWDTMTINSSVASPNPSPLLPSPVPEPATVLLMASAILAVAATRHK